LSVISKRQKLEIMRTQLENERTSFKTQWRDLSDYILPNRARYTLTEGNRGDRRNQKIIDSTATMAARTLSSGMMSGVTSPARPWFRLTTPDPELAEFGPVRDWLYTVQQRMATSFLRSNVYNILPMVYKDLGTFGTAPYIVEENFENIIHAASFPVGSYCIAKDQFGKVNTFMREFRMTVAQVVEKFGQKNKSGSVDWSNMSSLVKQQYEAGNYQTWIDIIHFITPNDEYKPDNIESKYKKFYSCYYEKGTMMGSESNYMSAAGIDNQKFLREMGYDYFPVLCPRWETTGEDVYGTDCPGMTAIGDIKQLQLGERRIAQAIEKMINPALVGGSSLRNQKVSLLPGDITYDDAREGRQGLRAIHEVQLRIQEVEQKQAQVRERVQRAFFEDLFLMLAQSDRRQITAREIDERHEEKLLALGPVLEQLNQDSNDPLIDIAFDIHMRQGLIPPPPEEVQGSDLKVEYISMMAQAQKLVGIGGVERFAGFVMQAAQVDPSVLQKVNADQMIDVYADMTSVPPSIVRTDEQVSEMRQAQAAQQAKQQQMMMVKEASAAAKNLSQADLSGDNALSRMAGAGTGGLA
jgi:hypothetical protein